ncbi:hypothetical protein QNA08_14625 [Chelatococcus sp. SYSU_G07232]|uniref:3',5'-cyclic-nucleotide phosphodiesterase n=1 Tax=Chelatococcus albus TaxID=3047466 RepID=A0ABT7AJB6_9HYPH|nr:hypothetical protein [Chelatococcus sp. SYSU_G07232]MDJ1159470.1 hypothetical protein [Chelatococcus sp. SYSU_G07232]
MILRLAFALLIAAPGVASAQSAKVPRLAVEKSCRGAAAQDPGDKGTFDSCMKDENDARAELGKRWATYKAADRRECVSLTTSEPHDLGRSAELRRGP